MFQISYFFTKFKCRHNEPRFQFINIKKIFENSFNLHFSENEYSLKISSSHKKEKNCQKLYQKTGQHHWYLEE